MSFHISAETIVGIAQGTKMPARTMPAAPECLGHDQRHRHTENGLQEHADDGDEGGIEEGVPEAVHGAVGTRHRVWRH